MAASSPRKTAMDVARPAASSPEAADTEGGCAEASRPAKRARTSPQMHADIHAIVELVCDVEMMRRYVASAGFDATSTTFNIENLNNFSIKQGLTWLRAIEQELLKIEPSPESLVALSKSCFKAVGFSGGGQTIDSLEQMKAKAQSLEVLADVEGVYARLLRIAAGTSGKKKAESDSEDDIIDLEKIDEEAEAAAVAKKKRPTTPFFAFLGDRRETLSAELNTRKPTEVVKRASEIWKAMNEEEREPWDGPYKAAKAKYDEEKAVKKAQEEAQAWIDDPLPSRQYRMLDCHLSSISRGSAVWRLINESALSTQPQIVEPDAHFVSVERMFSITRPSEEKHYAKNAQSTNRRLLWYSGPLATWASVLSNGLHLPQPETPFTGYSFGKGIYFSDMVSVAAANADAGESGTAIVALCEVALGKAIERHQVDARGSSKLPTGYHSTIGRGMLAPTGSRALPDGVHLPLGPIVEQPAPALAIPSDCARLPHNEFVVYNPASIRMRYIMEVRLISGKSQDEIGKVLSEAERLADADVAPLNAKRLRKKTSADQTLLAS